MLERLCTQHWLMAKIKNWYFFNHHTGKVWQVCLIILHVSYEYDSMVNLSYDMKKTMVKLSIAFRNAVSWL